MADFYAYAPLAAAVGVRTSCVGAAGRKGKTGQRQRTYISSYKEEATMEKVYKTMSYTGMVSIIVGIVLLIWGAACGVLSIVNGALLLKRRREITF